jgi:hypothetical protein
MQRDDGGVYHKVTCAYFPDIAANPQEETADLFVFPVSTAATGDFAAILAMAAPLYESIDRTFSKKCLRASINAYEFLKHSKQLPFHNPSGVVTEIMARGDTDDAILRLRAVQLRSAYILAPRLYRLAEPQFRWRTLRLRLRRMSFGQRSCEDAILAAVFRGSAGVADQSASAPAPPARPLDYRFLWGSNMYLQRYDDAAHGNDIQQASVILPPRVAFDYILCNKPWIKSQPA